jgi:hypothetical protein
LAYALRCNVVSSRSPPVEEESKLFQALDYLNATGVGLFLRASQTERSILLLDQSLLAEIFATLSSTDAEKFAGDIPVDELHSNIWREFDSPLRDCILEVLARNEIVLESPKGGSIILPPSLPKSRPDLRDTWPLLTDSPVTFSRVYNLPFLPSEIFSRCTQTCKTPPDNFASHNSVIRSHGATKKCHHTINLLEGRLRSARRKKKCRAARAEAAHLGNQRQCPWCQLKFH